MSKGQRMGYAAIESPVEEGRGPSPGHSSRPVSPLVRQKSSFLSRRKMRSYKDNARLFIGHHIYHILALSIITVILSMFIISALLPDTPSSLPPSSSSPIPSDSDHYVKNPTIVKKVGISERTMKEGLAKCGIIDRNQRLKKQEQDGRPRTHNPRAEPEQQPILIKNAVVWDGQGQVLENVQIFIDHGVIQQIGRKLNLSEKRSSNIKVIDAEGHIVSPGLVDMHSHIGLASWPLLEWAIDVNEMSGPITPFVRSIDAFNPFDNAIRIVSSGGVTTSLVLPGSTNVMGGEAFAFKLRLPTNVSNENMLVQAYVNGEEEVKRRWLKAACGENPKRLYATRNEMPVTRLGEAFLFRKELSRAQALKRAQDDWCEAAQQQNYSSAEEMQEENSATSRPRILLDTPFPEDLRLEPVVALLRDDAYLNIHCYDTFDIEAMIRHSIEFNFTINSIHHAAHAFLSPSILTSAPYNLTVATFADRWGYTAEEFKVIPEGPKILHDAGIPIAFKSDHPVSNSQHLVFEAAKAVHYGFDKQDAFSAVTSIPANALGLGHRIGSLKEGYDADVVIWDREPLELGAAPLQVLIDGVPLFDDNEISSEKTLNVAPTSTNTNNSKLKHTEKNQQQQLPISTGSFLLRNAAYSFLNNEPEEGPLDILVHNGSVVCSDKDCTSVAASIFDDASSIPDYDLQGGYVLPGLIGVGSSIGLVELQGEESSTGDGHVPPNRNPDDLIEAIDGLKFNTRHLEMAYKGGILTFITAPISQNVVGGISAAFKTNANSILEEGSIISPAVALHLQIGAEAKSAAFPTISSQIKYIRQLLKSNVNSDNEYGRAARGEIPTIVATNNKDEIASIIALKRQHLPQARFVIQGGAEAHLLAPYLAEQNIPVVLEPTLCTPANFDSIHCLTGAPLTNGTAAHVLHQYGVKLGLGIAENGFARNLIWDAGWLAATSPVSNIDSRPVISEIEAVRFVSSNLRNIYGLADSLDMNEDFVVYTGNPFDMESRILLIHSKRDGIIAP